MRVGTDNFCFPRVRYSGQLRAHLHSNRVIASCITSPLGWPRPGRPPAPAHRRFRAQGSQPPVDSQPRSVHPTIPGGLGRLAAGIAAAWEPVHHAGRGPEAYQDDERNEYSRPTPPVLGVLDQSGRNSMLLPSNSSTAAEALPEHPGRRLWVLPAPRPDRTH